MIHDNIGTARRIWTSRGDHLASIIERQWFTCRAIVRISADVGGSRDDAGRMNQPSASIPFATSVIFGGPNHRPVGNKRPARSRLAPPRLVFVLDLVTRLMDRGRAPVCLLFRSSSPSSSSSFLSLPFRDFLLIKMIAAKR